VVLAKPGGSRFNFILELIRLSKKKFKKPQEQPGLFLGEQFNSEKKLNRMGAHLIDALAGTA